MRETNHLQIVTSGLHRTAGPYTKYMVKRCSPPSQGWRTFLRNHAPDIAAMDLFVVPYTTNTSECKFATGTAVRFWTLGFSVRTRG